MDAPFAPPENSPPFGSGLVPEVGAFTMPTCTVCGASAPHARAT